MLQPEVMAISAQLGLFWLGQVEQYIITCPCVLGPGLLSMSPAKRSNLKVTTEVTTTSWDRMSDTLTMMEEIQQGVRLREGKEKRLTMFEAAQIIMVVRVMLVRSLRTRRMTLP